MGNPLSLNYVTPKMSNATTLVRHFKSADKTLASFEMSVTKIPFDTVLTFQKNSRNLLTVRKT